MSVLASEDAVHIDDAEQGGRTVWFCGPGCRKAFLADPDAYPLTTGR